MTEKNNKLKLYSKVNLQGNAYLVDYGNYVGQNFTNRLSPDNVFSMEVPPQSTVKLFGGAEYDYGTQGSFHLSNTTRDYTRVNQLPENIQGKVRSMIVMQNTNPQQQVVDVSLSGVTTGLGVGTNIGSNTLNQDSLYRPIVYANINGSNDVRERFDNTDSPDQLFPIFIIFLFSFFLLKLLKIIN
jgi:hypothetical protein